MIQVVREPKIYLDRNQFNELKDILYGNLDSFLKENQLKEGMGKEELKMRLPRRSDPRFFGPLLAALEKEGKVVVERDLVTIKGRKGTATVDQAGLQAKIEAALKKGGIEAPTLKEMCDSLRCQERELLEHLNILARDGRVVKLKSDVFYSPVPLAEIKEKLVKYLKEKGEITPPEFRDITGLSRKFMIPLLEYFDQEKVTIRVGDKRVLRKG